MAEEKSLPKKRGMHNPSRNERVKRSKKAKDLYEKNADYRRTYNVLSGQLRFAKHDMRDLKRDIAAAQHLYETTKKVIVMQQAAQWLKSAAQRERFLGQEISNYQRQIAELRSAYGLSL